MNELNTHAHKQSVTHIHKKRTLLTLCVVHVWAWFISACATPSLTSPDSPLVSPSPVSGLPIHTPTPLRVALLPPTRTPVQTPTPAPTVPAIQSGLAQITVGENFFYPDIVTVTVGTVIRWNHVGTMQHDVTAENFSWSMGSLSIGSYYEYTFSSVGTYPYICYIHRPGMWGMVVVLNP